MNNDSRFSNGFMLGLIIGGGAVFLLGTKTGKKILKSVSEQGMDQLNEILEEAQRQAAIEEEEEESPAPQPENYPVNHEHRKSASHSHNNQKAEELEVLAEEDAEDASMEKKESSKKRFFKRK